MAEQLTIIGVGISGEDSLTKEGRTLLNIADQVWGSRRLLSMFPNLSVPTVELNKEILPKLEKLKDRPDGKRIVLLASGDPNFHGLAGTIFRLFPDEKIHVIPQPSLIQEAFAAAGISWENAAFLSAHSKFDFDINACLSRYQKIGILCGPKALPQDIARKVITSGRLSVQAVVCANLGQPDEQTFRGSISECAALTFPALSVLLLLQPPEWKPEPEGIVRPDEAYSHRNGLITKHDIRLICLSRMQITQTDVIWDIGAGSGALSIEAAERAWHGKVFAIEKDNQNLDFIKENQSRYRRENLEIIGGEAPDVLNELPDPNAIFIGGSGGKLSAILDAIAKRNQPIRIVMTFVIIQNLCDALRWFHEKGIQTEVIQAAFSTMQSIGEGNRFVPQNPVYILDAFLLRTEQ